MRYSLFMIASGKNNMPSREYHTRTRSWTEGNWSSRANAT